MAIIFLWSKGKDNITIRGPRGVPYVWFVAVVNDEWFVVAGFMDRVVCGG